MTGRAHCPACDSIQSQPWHDCVWQRPNMTVLRCADCSLVYLHPMMEEDEERRFYADYGKNLQQRGTVGSESPEVLFERTKPVALDIVQVIQPYLTETMSLVEIGASAGAFCSAVREHVSSVSGIEPSQPHREHMSSIGITAVPYLDELDPDKKFDAAAFFHLLEHMRKPVQFLRNISNLLAPDAYVFVEVPNLQDALLSLYKIKAFKDFYYQAQHCLYFSPETLQQAFHSAGFSTVELIPKQRYDLSNHMVWMQEGKPGGTGRFETAFNPDLETAYAGSLKEQWLCDTIFGVFRRE